MPRASGLEIKFALIVCDVSVDPSPVFYQSRDEFEPIGPADAPSIGTMIQLWIDSIDRGDVRIDPTYGRWTREPGLRAGSRLA